MSRRYSLFPPVDAHAWRSKRTVLPVPDTCLCLKGTSAFKRGIKSLANRKKASLGNSASAMIAQKRGKVNGDVGMQTILFAVEMSHFMKELKVWIISERVDGCMGRGRGTRLVSRQMEGGPWQRGPFRRVGHGQVLLPSLHSLLCRPEA